jgi:hypothetical protein
VPHAPCGRCVSNSAHTVLPAALDAAMTKLGALRVPCHGSACAYVCCARCSCSVCACTDGVLRPCGQAARHHGDGGAQLCCTAKCDVFILRLVTIWIDVRYLHQHLMARP